MQRKDPLLQVCLWFLLLSGTTCYVNKATFGVFNFSILDGINYWREFCFLSQKDNLPFSECEPQATSHPRHLQDTVRGAAHSMWSTLGLWLAALEEEAFPRFSPSQFLPRHLGQRTGRKQHFFFSFYWLLTKLSICNWHETTYHWLSWLLFIHAISYSWKRHGVPCIYI